MADKFRVFLSTVSSEFESARDALAKDLLARGLEVKWQQIFRQEATADTLLRLLHDYVRDCDAVVCVHGTRSGDVPPPKAVTDTFGSMLPDRCAQASFTQWEFFFARAHKKWLSLYRAGPGYTPDKRTGLDIAGLQDTFLRHIDAEGLHFTPFESVDRLCREVLKEHWPDHRPNKPVVLPYPSIGELFMGRDDFLQRLRDSLTRGGAAAISAPRALHGMGGVGKTRAAVEYAWRYLAHYNAVALLDAETPDRLTDSLAALTGPLRLAEHAATETDVKMRAALDWLNANPGWFLILDNLDTQPALNAAHRLLGQLTGGHVVLTSRLDVFPGEIELLDLDVLGLDDATAFVLAATKARRVKSADDTDQARTLARDLGQLALALEMAAATIRAKRLCFAEYRAMWQGNRDRVIGWAKQ